VHLAVDISNTQTVVVIGTDCIPLDVNLKYHMINAKTAVRILIVFHHDALINHLSGVMYSVLASSLICRGFAKHAALRRKSKDLLARFSIMCPSGATCLYSDCCFSELAL
jgi:hypothetical protein